MVDRVVCKSAAVSTDKSYLAREQTSLVGFRTGQFFLSPKFFAGGHETSTSLVSVLSAISLLARGRDGMD